jgi:TolB-like protein
MKRDTALGHGGLRIWLLVALMAVGCNSHYLTRSAQSANFVNHPHIGIVPFDNFAGKDMVAAKVTDYFQTMMAGSAQYTVIESGTAYNALRRNRIRSALLLDSAQIDILAQELKVDYILTGSVLDYSELDNTYLGKVPQVSFNARLIDCKTKQTVWTGVSNDTGDRKELLFGVGATRSADELARQMVQKLVENLDKHFKK